MQDQLPEGYTERFQHSLLSCLRSREMESRYERVSDAHAKAFE